MSEKPAPKKSDTEKNDPEKIRSPGGLNMRERHELVKKSHAHDQADPRARSKSPWGAPNQLKQPQNRWQRLVRYVWDKKR